MRARVAYNAAFADAFLAGLELRLDQSDELGLGREQAQRRRQDEAEADKAGVDYGQVRQDGAGRLPRVGRRKSRVCLKRLGSISQSESCTPPNARSCS